MPSQEWCKTGTVCRRYTLVQCQGRSLQLKKTMTAWEQFVYIHVFILWYFSVIQGCTCEKYLCVILSRPWICDIHCAYFTKYLLKINLKFTFLCFVINQIWKIWVCFLMTWDWFVLMVLMVSINFGSVESLSIDSTINSQISLKNKSI